MPLRVNINGKEIVITPTEAPQTLDFPEEIKTFEVNRNFYVDKAKPTEPKTENDRRTE
jgi:hypothetical protein